MTKDHSRHAGMGHTTARPTTASSGGAHYTCPMHPEVKSATPGKCPKCGMTLVPVAASGEQKL